MMISELAQLIVLFFVIIDPLATFTVFMVASSSMKDGQRKKAAMYAISIAIVLSGLVLVLGQKLLEIFSTTLDEFRIAGGIILGILGIKMTLGIPLKNLDELKGNSAMAIASVIGTPLITGPATITAIILSSNDYGRLITGIAVAIVLFFTGLFLFFSKWFGDFLGRDLIRIISTLLGLITIAWGVKFITVGIQNIFLG